METIAITLTAAVGIAFLAKVWSGLKAQPMKDRQHILRQAATFRAEGEIYKANAWERAVETMVALDAGVLE